VRVEVTLAPLLRVIVCVKCELSCFPSPTGLSLPEDSDAVWETESSGSAGVRWADGRGAVLIT